MNILSFLMTVNQINILTVFQDRDHYFPFLNNFIILINKLISELKKKKERRYLISPIITVLYKKKKLPLLILFFFLPFLFVCLQYMISN